MKSDSTLVELIKLFDPVEADLFAAFLEDGGIEFQMRRSARTMATIMPSSEVPISFHVYADDLERAKSLLEEYRRFQAASIPPDDKADIPPDDEAE